MFQLMKDIRRRSVENLMLSVGASERTVDERFESSYKAFQQTAADLNGAGSSLSQSLLFQRTHLESAATLAASLSLMFHRCADMSETQSAAARKYSDRWTVIRETLLPAVETMCSERAMNPVSLALSLILPDIDVSVRARDDKLTDYDSCKRRMRALEEKREGVKSEKQGQASSSSVSSSSVRVSRSVEEVEAACQKFEFKLRAAENEYAELNDRACKDLDDARAKGSQLAAHFLLTIVVCQAELFTRAALELEAVISTLPADKVADIRSSIDGLLKSKKNAT